MRFDAIVIGAGAAGMMCAAQIGAAGKTVALIDHAEKLGEKIRISGGGRCNFTNRTVGPENFLSANPGYAKHALRAYTPEDFLCLLKHHGLSYTEKHKGQLFCDQKSQAIIDMLADECNSASVRWMRPCSVQQVQHSEGRFRLNTSMGAIESRQLVVATGGLPVPKIGATDFGLRLAKQFGHALIDTAPALVPLVFSEADWRDFSVLSGVAVPGSVRADSKAAPWFDEDILLTHRGLSGPGILQVSSYWRPGRPIVLNVSGRATREAFEAELINRLQGTRAQADKWLAAQLPHWPARLLDTVLTQPACIGLRGKKAAELGKKSLRGLVDHAADWRLVPTGTAGYAKAEVMRGGVSTTDLNPKRMESRRLPGLFFIGEVVDVTGWLGGYNFQWAWASAVAAARAVVGVSEIKA